MKIFVSVISHGHAKLIDSLGCLKKINESTNIVVVVKNNCKDQELIDYCIKNSIDYIDNEYGKGFGENNNIVYKYCVEKYKTRDCDLFLVLNPDVLIETEVLLSMLSGMKENSINFATLNLFKNLDKTIFDPSIRRFPKFLDFTSSFIGLGNKTIINKENIESISCIDWSAGSCLFFTFKHYCDLRGFDQNYFMYCEDIDICFRSKAMEEELWYFPNLHAIHLAKHANRNVFSKHFIWHINSVIKYLYYSSVSDSKRNARIISCI
ncbi:glycosyltransferase family 2 protein [Vibrio sp. BS-M-Sm-2]|uniref:glycosyltransferase family 2 protein n=1 Tax=Vibrio sp. BS-M-Sm-2 TaxID=3241167 RepID=UPI003555E890